MADLKRRFGVHSGSCYEPQMIHMVTLKNIRYTVDLPVSSMVMMVRSGMMRVTSTPQYHGSVGYTYSYTTAGGLEPYL